MIFTSRVRALRTHGRRCRCVTRCFPARANVIRASSISGHKRSMPAVLICTAQMWPETINNKSRQSISLGMHQPIIGSAMIFSRNASASPSRARKKLPSMSLDRFARKNTSGDERPGIEAPTADKLLVMRAEFDNPAGRSGFRVLVVHNEFHWSKPTDVQPCARLCRCGCSRIVQRPKPPHSYVFQSLI